MTWFERHVTTRMRDYGWAYRLRIARLRNGGDPDRYRRGALRPVVLLPGVYETWHFLEAVGAHLNELGHPVHVVPTFARNIRPITEMALLAEEYLVDRDLRDVALVGHSKGGLIGKAVMLSQAGNDRVSLMVAINSPFGGSDYAHLVPLRTLREFVPTHDTIVNLAANADANSRITSIFSEWDPIIPNGSVLEGATNIRLPARGHFNILDRSDLLEVVARVVARVGT